MRSPGACEADIAVGEVGWALIRGQLYAVSFLGVMAAMGLTHTWWVLMALPACALIGFCFASLGFVGTTFMRGWTDMDIVTTITMPLFLFSATFFPVSAYGSWRWIVQVSPLYHGVALVRAAATSTFGWPSLAHAVVLLSIAITTLLWADLSNRFIWVVLLVTLVFSLGAGMLASALCVNSKSAAGLTFALLASAGFMSLLLAALLSWMLPKFGWNQAAVDQRLGPPGALPVKPTPPRNASIFFVRLARSCSAIADVKPT